MSNVPNPPAFPVDVVHPGGGGGFTNEGMSLRDYFAGQALTGLIAAPDLAVPTEGADLTRLAYELADLMLKERSK